MNKLIFSAVLLCVNILCVAQVAIYEPILREYPTPPNLGFLNEISEKNKSCLEFIYQLQNQILDVKQKTNDRGAIDILDKYYAKLELLKQIDQILYTREAELRQIPLDLKEELIKYKPAQEPKERSSNIENNGTLGLKSSSYTETIWNNTTQKYDVVKTYEVESQFYLLEGAIYFKKGNADWLMNRWTFQSREDDKNLIIWRDELNQTVLIDTKMMNLAYFHDFDGVNYKKMTAYNDLTRDSNIFPPGKNQNDTNAQMISDHKLVRAKGTSYIYSEPTYNSELISKVPSDRFIQFIDNFDALWCRVKVNGHLGYTLRSSLVL